MEQRKLKLSELGSLLKSKEQCNMYRITVTPEQSKVVQETIFSTTDVVWCADKDTVVKHTEKTYLFIDDLNLSFSNSVSDWGVLYQDLVIDYEGKLWLL